MLSKNRLKAFDQCSLLPFACLSIIALSAGYSSNSTTSRNGGTTENTNAQSDDLELAVVSDFVDRVVIPTYNLLVEKAGELNKAGDENNPAYPTVDAAVEEIVQNF